MGSNELSGYFSERLPIVPSHAAGYAFVVFIASQILLTIYRLFFSPLVGYPGPKLAAVSYWYEYYWDVTRKGRFIFKIQELHERYGPIVRINPNELHVNDPDFFNEIYHGNKWVTDRDRWFNLDFHGEGLAFTTDHDIHAIRRHGLAQYFSMQSIRALEPRITNVVEQMTRRLHQAKNENSTVNLYYLFTAFAMDVITEYAFGDVGSTKLMSRQDFGKEWSDLTTNMLPINNFARQFKTFMKVMMSIPEHVMVQMNPSLAGMIQWQDSLTLQIKQVIKNKDKPRSETEPLTVIHELLNSELPAREKRQSRLRDEARMVVGAGAETTAQTLTRAFYHIIANPPILKRLREELESAIPDPAVIPSLQTLQNLPYLSAVVEEGVRISLPVTARSPRIFRDHTLRYGKWEIKPGTAVSMSPYVVSTNPTVFPEPFKFQPDRWVDNKGLTKYAVTFGKGRRACLGKNLAYAELWFAVAVSFRRFDFELFETTIEDVTVAHDFFIGVAKQGSLGVRVKVTDDVVS